MEHFLCLRTKFPMAQTKLPFRTESAIVFKQPLRHWAAVLTFISFNFLFHGFSEQISLFRLDISLCGQKLCTQYRTAAAPRSVLWERPTNFQS